MKLPTEKKKFYDFYRDGVTQSMIMRWLRCPRQCKIEYVDGWASHKHSDALTFGNCVHHVLQRAYSRSSCPMPGNIKSYIAEYLEIQHTEEASSELQEQIEISCAKAEGVLRYYFIKYQDDFLRTWEIAEEIFKVPFRFPDGRKIPLTGKIDGGFKVNANDELWLIDHKCKGRIVLDDILTILPVDFQINFYLYCMSSIGENPRGFFYNLIRNPQSKPKRDEQLEDFSDRIAEKVAEDPKHYFTRVKVPFTQEEIKDWGKKQLTPILRDMRHWWDSDCRWPEYYNPEQLETKYGLCDMVHAIVENDFSYYRKKSHPFEEL